MTIEHTFCRFQDDPEADYDFPVVMQGGIYSGDYGLEVEISSVKDKDGNDVELTKAELITAIHLFADYRD